MNKLKNLSANQAERFFNWWRRGELHPRPKCFKDGFYRLIRLFKSRSFLLESARSQKNQPDLVSLWVIRHFESYPTVLRLTNLAGEEKFDAH